MFTCLAPDGGYQEEAGDRGRWRLWEDLPPHCIQQRPVPRGVRSHRVWELRGRHRGGRQTGGQSFLFGLFFWDCFISLKCTRKGQYANRRTKRSLYKIFANDWIGNWQVSMVWIWLPYFQIDVLLSETICNFFFHITLPLFISNDHLSRKSMDLNFDEIPLDAFLGCAQSNFYGLQMHFVSLAMETR